LKFGLPKCWIGEDVEKICPFLAAILEIAISPGA